MSELIDSTFYTNVFKNLGVAIIVTNINSADIIDANVEASKLTSYKCNELMNMNLFDLYSFFERNKIKQDFFELIERIKNKKEINPYDCSIYDHNKNLIPVEITISLIKSKQNSNIVLLIKDLREKKTYENMISYYNKSLEKSSVYLSFIDNNYIYKNANESYANAFNYNKEKIIGKSIADVFGREHFETIIKDKFDKALLGEYISYESEVKINGNILYLEAHYQPYYSIDGEISGVVVDVHDLSKFKKFEEENRKQERLLIQKSKMAAMGEMIENIAHQWRQPLSLISTCSSGIILQKEFNTLSDDVLLDSLNKIKDTTFYLSDTINDFKNFFEKDKEKSEFCINSNIDKILNLTNMSYLGNDIEIIKNYEENIVIKSYKNEFMQIILNVINNAKDAILSNEKLKKRRRLICISIYTKDNKTIIDIKDNAGGIPASIIDKIFDPYFTTKHKSQGTGIGLFMTREIVVKHMKGTIEAENIRFNLNGITYSGALFRICI